MPDFRRAVRSTPGPLTYSTLMLAVSIFAPPRVSNATLRGNSPYTLAGETNFTPGPRVIERLASVPVGAGRFASSAVMSWTGWPKACVATSSNKAVTMRKIIGSPFAVVSVPDLHTMQRLKGLREHALIESAVSSNRIEGVSVEPSRVREVLVIGNSPIAWVSSRRRVAPSGIRCWPAFIA